MPAISLHIGLPHAGSTSIQHLLSDNRTTLASRGILYPDGIGRRSHGKLAVYAMDEKRIDDRRRRLGIGDAAGVRAFREAFAKQFAADLEHGRPERAILSFEALSWDLRTAEEIARLRALLTQQGHVDRIVIYLRPQPELLVSRHATSLKRGRAQDISLLRGISEFRSFDFRRTVGLWRDVFGQDCMRVRVLDPADLVGGDLHEDAAEALAIPLDALPLRPPPGNEGLDVQALAYLRLLNKHLPSENGAMSPAAHSLVDVMRKTRSGPKSTAPGWKLAAFQRLFEAGNRQIARQFFRRDDLFPRPALAAGRARLGMLTVDEIMAMTARLWIAREEELAGPRKGRRSGRGGARRAAPASRKGNEP